MQATGPGAVRWRAAVFAGVAAGILATLVQIALWAAFTDALPAALFRDARFAAAIVTGPAVLPPPATFDARVILAATLVHFTLSIVYGLALSALIAGLSLPAALFAGTAFGLSLYAVNMYAFTAVFPWFAEDRDWITATAHAAFGVSAAGVYKALARPRIFAPARQTRAPFRRGPS
jgi:hypothetical protein